MSSQVRLGTDSSAQIRPKTLEGVSYCDRQGQVWHDLRCSSIRDFIGDLQIISTIETSNKTRVYTYDIDTTIPGNSNDGIECTEVHADHC